MLQLSFVAFFSGGHRSSPVSKTPSGECKAITNRSYEESDLTLSFLVLLAKSRGGPVDA